MTLIRHALRFVLVAAALTNLGCSGGGGDGLPRRAVAGKVTLDGKPLDAALLIMMPETPGESPTPASAQVKDGAFAIPAETGPVAGRYKVSVSVQKPVSRKGAQQPAGGAVDDFDTTPTKESLPARYNSQTTLTADVTDTGPNEFNFPLTSR